MDSLSKLANVLCGDTSHRDTTVGGEVDVVLLGQDLTLVLVEAGVREHTDLVGDVVPVLLRATCNDGVTKESAHLVNAASHGLDLIEPLLLELGVGENSSDDTSTVEWRVGVDSASDNLEESKVVE